MAWAGAGHCFCKNMEGVKDHGMISRFAVHAILTAIIMLSEDLYTRKIGKEFLESYTIGDTIGIVILSAICIYFFGGVAYLIWELLKAE